jgi:hypothetical protein
VTRYVAEGIARIDELLVVTFDGPPLRAARPGPRTAGNRTRRLNDQKPRAAATTNCSATLLTAVTLT